jgi:hypothetical protein
MNPFKHHKNPRTLNGLKNRFRAISGNCLLFLSILGMVYTVPSFAANPRDYVDYYIDWYGTASEDSEVAQAHEIFERIKQVADKNRKFLNPKLKVLKNKGRNPLARALRDGYIIIWRSAIDICHVKTASKAAQEACLAFILGHELGHLAKDDYWHLDIDCQFSGRGCYRSKLFTRERMRRELAADGEGYAYAAMAGYRVNLLLGKGANQDAFLKDWVKQVKAPRHSVYPTVEKRVAVLHDYLQELAEKLIFFDFGLRLSHFDRCDDGEYFLREFQHVFPAREVLNNRGFCYLQRARQEMEGERADFYWMPLLLDVESLAAPLVMGKKAYRTLKQASASRQGEGFLKEAVIYFKKAIEADRGYVPAKVNLAVSYLYLGKPHQARGLLEEVSWLAPDNLEIQGLQALALYEQSEADLDLWPRAVTRLVRLANDSKAPPAILYNLARLWEIRPRPAQAHRYWNRLAYLSASLPESIRAIVCRQQSAVHNCEGDKSNDSDKRPPWEWPIPFEWQPLSEQTTVMNELYRWERPISFNWYREQLRGHIYQRPDGRVAVLELDDFMQMQVLKGDNLGHVSQLSNYCGQALRQRHLARGILWSCSDWAALTFEDKVEEVWRVLR